MSEDINLGAFHDTASSKDYIFYEKSSASHQGVEIYKGVIGTIKGLWAKLHGEADFVKINNHRYLVKVDSFLKYIERSNKPAEFETSIDTLKNQLAPKILQRKILQRKVVQCRKIIGELEIELHKLPEMNLQDAKGKRILEKSLRFVQQYLNCLNEMQSKEYRTASQNIEYILTSLQPPMFVINSNFCKQLTECKSLIGCISLTHFFAYFTHLIDEIQKLDANEQKFEAVIDKFNDIITGSDVDNIKDILDTSLVKVCLINAKYLEKVKDQLEKNIKNEKL